MSAAISRARALRLIDAERYQSLNIQLSSRGWRKHEPVNVGMEHPVLLKQMIQAAYGVGAGVSTDQPVRSFEASDALGAPFHYLDYWAGGLVEEGADMGFYEKRIKEVASDRSVVSAEKEWRPEGIYGKNTVSA